MPSDEKCDIIETGFKKRLLFLRSFTYLKSVLSQLIFHDNDVQILVEKVL